jgi:DNA-binding PadR family transcriptional regulator
MKLTGRQKIFLGQFLDLYRQDREPIHYTTMAEELGVGKITAYDMLRLLEEKGLVSSEYVLPEGGRERGRSTVLFRPTQKATEVIADLAGDKWDREEWTAVKERILGALHAGKGTDYEGLLDEILLRIPQRKTSMLYAAETITAVILNLYQVREEAEAAGLFDYVRRMGRPGELGLSALAGLTMGLSLVERANRRFTSQLLSYARRYQDSLSTLSGESRRALADFAREVMNAMGL